MEKVSWTDRVRNEVFRTFNEQSEYPAYNT